MHCASATCARVHPNTFKLEPHLAEPNVVTCVLRVVIVRALVLVSTRPSVYQCLLNDDKFHFVVAGGVFKFCDVVM